MLYYIDLEQQNQCFSWNIILKIENPHTKTLRTLRENMFKYTEYLMFYPMTFLRMYTWFISCQKWKRRTLVNRAAFN